MIMMITYVQVMRDNVSPTANSRRIFDGDLRVNEVKSFRPWGCETLIGAHGQIALILIINGYKMI